MSSLCYSGRGGRRLVEVLCDPSQVDLGFAPNVETASRREKAQNAAWVHVAREMGNVDSIREELVRMNRDRPGQSLGLTIGRIDALLTGQGAKRSPEEPSSRIRSQSRRIGRLNRDRERASDGQARRPRSP